MTGNEIREEGVKALSEILKVNTTLTSLDLSCEEEKKKEKRKNRKQRRMNDRE